MSNHRAGKRQASPRRAAEPTGEPTRPASSVGKRKAVKPSKSARRPKAAREPKPAPRPKAAREPKPAPRPNATPSPKAAPAPQAAREAKLTPVRSAHSSTRKNLFPILPSAPTLVGAAALVIAAGGALTVGQNAGTTEASAGTITRLAAQANVLTGSSKVESSDAASSRQDAVSRDSEREALQDAADEKLLAAAEAQAQERNAALAQLAASAEQRADQIAANAWQLPIAPGLYHLTAGFGDISSLWATTHTGLDFAAPYGTPIRSISRGVVTSTSYAGSYGNRTIVTLGDGTELWYCHQTSFEVTPGQAVMPGQEIGTVGATGNVTGSHLHLEVRPGAGDPVDPYTALVVRGLSP